MLCCKLLLYRISLFGIILFAGCLWTMAADSPQSPKLISETKAEHDARMAWWREARFGMFIHWGLYAIPAGQWEGKFVEPGGGEWIQNTAQVPAEGYQKLTKRFNPVKYDPAAWIRLAKAAGMKYVVITSKHHDGFCLFDSKATDYNVAKATPYGKDLLKPLADECRKQGLHFCTYYSIMDWHHPAQYRASKEHYNPTNVHPERKAEYLAFMKQQLKELLDGPNPDVLWFDGEWLNWWKEADAVDMYNYLRKTKPSLLINNRLGTGRQGMAGLDKTDRRYAGDFGTPEQEIPATGLPGVDWETCMTMNDTWGYRTDDKNWKSTEQLVRQLIDSAAKGGNYLLNVGPTADGEIPQESIERLQGVGKWMAVNGEAIYGTTASPFPNPAWGRCTQKPGKLFLHVFDWPKGELAVPAVKDKVENAYLLSDPQQKPLAASQTDGGVTIKLPAEAPDNIASVVVLSLTDSTPESAIRFSAIEPATPVMPRADTACIAELEPGKLMVVYHKYEQSKLAGNDFGICRIWSKISHDGGLTWGEGRMLVDNAPGDVNVQAPAILKLSTGDVLLICHRTHSRSSSTMRLFRSRDGARTFVEEPPIWKRSPGQWLQGGASSLLELKSGRILLPLHGGTGDQGKQKNDIWCFISDDQGKTWRSSRGRIMLPKRGAMEASVAQLDDGMLVMSIRTQLGGPYLSRSRDEGETWDEAWPTGLEGGESCTCLRRIPGTNHLVLFWNNTPFIPKGHSHFGIRTPLTAAVSADAGKTWRVVGNIVADPQNAYTNIGCTFTSQNQAVITYMTSRPAKSRDNMNLEAAIVDRAWFDAK